MEAWFRRIFINRNLFFLWAGQVVSQTGDSIYEIGLLWIMLELTGSNAATGLVAMAGYLPTLLFGLYAGALADRFNRRRLMMFADMVRVAMVFLIPLLYFTGGLTGLLLGIFTFLIAIFNSLFLPARDSLVPRITGGQQLRQANSLIQTSWQFSLLLGPALAGLLIPLLGIIHLFNFDALTFLISFIFIYKIKTTPRESLRRVLSVPQQFRQSFKDVLDGLIYARKDKIIWVLLLITAVDNLFIMGPAIVGVPIFVREILQEGATSYAFVQVAYAIGLLSGTLFLNLFGKKYRDSHILLTGIVLDGITFLPLLWVDTFWGMFLTLVVHSFTIPMIIIPRPTLIQKLVPAEMQGRVFSMISVAVVGLTAISMGLTGVISEFIPINVIYAVISLLAATCGAVGWFIRDFREAV
ncbi:MAG: MFS transporter [Calditrichia bacterium]